MTRTIVTQQGQDKTLVVVQGVPGPAGSMGPPGPAGGASFTRQAGETLSALRVVYESPTQEVFALDAADSAHIDAIAGVTLTSAAAGQSVTVQRGGVLDAAGLALTPGRVWLGAAGALTQTPPETDFDVLVGFATAAQRLYVSFDNAISLED